MSQAKDELVARAQDPNAELETLHQLAQNYPGLRPYIAANPRTYPALLEWLGTLGDPAVDAALEEYGIEVSASGEKLVKLNGIGMTVAGGALALGVFPRTSALTLAGLLVPTTIVGQAFWKEEDERKRSARLSGALSNAAIIGGLLLVAARRRR